MGTPDGLTGTCDKKSGDYLVRFLLGSMEMRIAAQSVAMLSSRLVHKGPGNSLGTMVNVIKGIKGQELRD